MYKAVLFDLDGTLLNTLEDLKDSLNYALRAHHLPPKTIEETRQMVGSGIRMLISRAVPEEVPLEVEELVFNTFNDYYKDHHSVKTKAYGGILELLKELKEQGILLGVVSNKSHYAVEPLMHHFFKDTFDAVIGVRDSKEKKPSPILIDRALKTLHVKQEDTIYVGDSDIDYLTAKACDMDYTIVTWGFRDREELEILGAKDFCENIDALRKRLLR